MAEQYTIKILPTEEFDKLPYKRAKTAMGASDPKTGIAYVRDTGFNDFTKATMEHELDELMSKTSPHEEDGIRYKDFSQAFGAFGSKLPSFAGKLGGGLGKLVGGGIDLLGAGAGKLGLPNFNIGSPSAAQSASSALSAGVPASPGYQSIIGSAGAGGSADPLKGLTNSKNISTSSFPGFGGRQLPSLPANVLPGGSSSTFSGFGSSNALNNTFSSGDVNVGGSRFSGAGQKATDFIKQIGSGFQGSNNNTGAGDRSLGENIGAAIPGIATSLAGNLFAPKVDPIDTSGIRNRLTDQVTGRGIDGPLFQEALSVGRNTLTTPVGEPNEAQFRSQDRQIDEALADNIEKLRNTFKSLNPGADPEGNSRFAEESARLQRDAAQLKAEARGNAVAQQIQDQLRTMEDFLNIDRAQSEQLIQIAQLELSELMFNTGLNAQEAQEFKSLFGGFGEILLRNQFPQQVNGQQTATA